MSRRNKIIIVVVAVLLILLALWLLWSRFFRVAPETIIVIPEDELVADIEETGPVEMIDAEESSRAPVEVSVDSLARTFAERYASYSNESDFANLHDLEPLMTESMWAETEVLIDSLEVEDIYHGVTSRAITITVPAMDDNDLMVSVEVVMQREDALGSPQNIEIKYETLVLDMVKESGTWKVDGATWQ